MSVSPWEPPGQGAALEVDWELVGRGEIAAVLLDLVWGVITPDQALHELRVLDILYPLPEAPAA